VIDVTDATFEREVLQAETPVVVDFWAPWCRPCEAVEKVFRELEAAQSRVLFARLDVDANVGVSTRYGVLSLPTAIMFSDGEPRSTVIGARPRAHYERVWSEWLGEAAK
jgi:thioredoxin 1